MLHVIFFQTYYDSYYQQGTEYEQSQYSGQYYEGQSYEYSQYYDGSQAPVTCTPTQSKYFIQIIVKLDALCLNL